MKTRINKKSILTVLIVFIVLIISFMLNSDIAFADGTNLISDNGIPVVYINIDETQGTIQEMIESPNHSFYCYGSLSIVVPEGFHYSDFPDTPCESLSDLSMSIRGRGNSTWMKSMEKPFKIKLDKKADIFGLGENKHWVLVANAFDPTLMRDRIIAWLGDEMGFEFTPRGVPVDLVMTGKDFGTKYMGSYYLSENVRVDENRLEIDELKKDDIDDEVITGGYLVQNGTQVNTWSPDRFYTTRGACWATDTPSFDTTDEVTLNTYLQSNEVTEVLPELGDGYENNKQQKYIQDHVQLIEDTLYQGGTAYRDLMDIESAAKYWLINDFALNADSYATGSTYFYKVRDNNGQIGKIYWGPLWDFDYAWNNKPETKGFTNEHVWLRPMFCDKSEGGFVEEISVQWPYLRKSLIKLIEDGGIIDKYYEETKASAMMDAPINRAYEPDFDYKSAVEELKTWIKDRIAWVDANIDTVYDLVHTVTFKVDNEVYMYAFKDTGMELEEAEVIPEKEGYVFVGWFDEDGNIIDRHLRIDKDRVMTAKFVTYEEATKVEDIAFRLGGDIKILNPHTSLYQMEYEVVPTDAQDKTIIWSSSDEKFAKIDENGLISFNGTGQTTITAKLSSGNERSFVLVITDSDPAVPESIKTEKEVIELQEGSQTALHIMTDPFPAKINNIEYLSYGDNIATVDRFGVITAQSPGKTNVLVTTTTETDEGQIILEKLVPVTVTIAPVQRSFKTVIPWIAIGIIVLMPLFSRLYINKKNRSY